MAHLFVCVFIGWYRESTGSAGRATEGHQKAQIFHQRNASSKHQDGEHDAVFYAEPGNQLGGRGLPGGRRSKLRTSSMEDMTLLCVYICLWRHNYIEWTKNDLTMGVVHIQKLVLYLKSSVQSYLLQYQIFFFYLVLYFFQHIIISLFHVELFIIFVLGINKYRYVLDYNRFRLCWRYHDT